MAVRIVRLGSPRARGEGLRIGTVRHPPRGVPRAEHASGNWYDAWLPELSPDAATVHAAQAGMTDREWARFERTYRSEMGKPAPRHLLDLLAALSHQTDFSVGCYCKDESRCHRSILRRILEEHGAALA